MNEALGALWCFFVLYFATIAGLSIVLFLIYNFNTPQGLWFCWAVVTAATLAAVSYRSKNA